MTKPKIDKVGRDSGTGQFITIKGANKRPNKTVIEGVPYPDYTAKKKTQHVVKNSSGGWAVKKGGSSRATKVYQTQSEAIVYGREIAKSQNAVLYIHDRDGKIREKDNYARDPKLRKIKNKA